MQSHSIQPESKSIQRNKSLHFAHPKWVRSKQIQSNAICRESNRLGNHCAKWFSHLWWENWLVTRRGQQWFLYRVGSGMKTCKNCTFVCLTQQVQCKNKDVKSHILRSGKFFLDTIGYFWKHFFGYVWIFGYADLHTFGYDWIRLDTFLLDTHHFFWIRTFGYAIRV